MQVRLEMDRREEFRFSTFRTAIGNYRNLLIRIDGRPFGVWYMLNDFQMEMHGEDYLKHVDDMLARQFEAMIGRLLTVAAKIIPEGVDLTTASDDDIKWALYQASRSIPGVKIDGV